jgi:hypothetical protein
MTDPAAASVLADERHASAAATQPPGHASASTTTRYQHTAMHQNTHFGTILAVDG